MRNLGVAVSFSLQAVASIEKGLSRVAVNKVKLNEELSGHYELLAEPV
jgi:adenylosuccinate lyase